MKTSLKAIALAGLLGLGLNSGALAQELKVGVKGGPEGLDPHSTPRGVHVGSLKNVLEALVWTDEKLQLKPGLALSWRNVSDTVWEFKLRPNVKFHNGESFTAKDVKYSIDRVAGAAGPDGGATLSTRSISKVDVIDDLTVRFTTSAPNSLLPTNLASVLMLPASTGALKGAEITVDKLIGTGPFRMTSIKPRAEFVLERFAGYWGAPAPWAKATYFEISNDAARVAALTSKRVDLIDQVPYADVRQLKNNKEFSVIQGDSIFIFSMHMDVREKPTEMFTDKSGAPLAKNPLSDPRVREAISLAIDRNTMANTVLEGLARPANSYIMSGSVGNPPNMPALPFNLDRSKQLLKDAGYPDGFNGSVNCTADRLPGDTAVCAALGQMLSRVGITAKVNAVPRTVFFGAKGKSEYTLSMFGWGDLTGDAVYSIGAYIHSPDKAKGFGAFNWNGYKNDEVDRLIGEGAGAVNQANRASALQKAVQLALNDRAVVPVVQLSTNYGVRAGAVTYTSRVDEETLAYQIKPAK